jgi:hypothetical protein
LEGCVVFIFRVEEQAKQDTNMKPAASSAYSATHKMEVTHSSKMLVEFQWTLLHYIPEDRTPHNRHCENLKS